MGESSSVDYMRAVIEPSNVAFLKAVHQWREAALKSATIRSLFEVEHAKALLEAKGSNESARKAEASLATSTVKLAAEQAEIEARAQHHVVMYLRGDHTSDVESES